MTGVKIEVLAGQVQAKIRELEAAGADLTPAWQAVGNNLVQRIRLGFRASQAPDGTRWLPIKWRAPRVKMKLVKRAGSQTYVQARAKSGALILTKAGKAQAAANAAGKAGQPLVDTGRLRRSIVAVAGPNDVVVGTSVIYAKTHQFGNIVRPKRAKILAFPGPDGEIIFAKSVKIPARPFMPIDRAGQPDFPPRWAESIVRVLDAHFRAASRA